MYARYSTLEFDAERLDDVRAHFAAEAAAGAGPAAQPGWRGSLVLETPTPGRLRAVTLWDSAEHFTRFHSGQRHSGINRTFDGLGVEVTEREAASTVVPPVLAGGHVRSVTVRIAAAERARTEEYWLSTGRTLILRQPGAVSAEGYWTDEEFTLLVSWTDERAAALFLASADHAAFAEGMGTGPGDVVARRAMDRITRR
ncbi:hypothetical protein JNUCC64_05105 [Streptomyces sp. JNUCC 64]